MSSNGLANSKNTAMLPAASIGGVGIFLDFHNLFPAVRNCGGTLDLILLRDYLGEGREIIETFVYAGTRPDHIEADQAFHRHLRRQGFFVRTKLARLKDDGSLKCNFDVEMAVDIIDFVEKARPDIVVLGSGDRDFRVVAERLRLQSIRVEVAATRETISGDLLDVTHGFIDLGTAVAEICQQPLTLANEATEEA